MGTKSNPADILSRGTTPKNLSNSILWFHGPQWLKEKPAWPDQKLCVISSINNVDVNMEKNDDEAQFLMDITKFSSLGKLLRVTNYVFRFIKNIFMKRGWTKNINNTNSMTFWVQEVQRECYSNEFRILHSLLENRPNKISEPSTKTPRQSKPSEPSIKTLRQNKLINDLGLFLRCRGRIHNSSLQYGAKHPVLLPKHHWLTRLGIRDAHYVTLHGGVLIP